MCGRSRGREVKPAFSRFLYRYRNLVERFFNQIKNIRAVATRYEKDPANFLAIVKLAAVRLWLPVWLDVLAEYPLRDGEARLTCRIACGRSVQEAAALLANTNETTRTILKL